VEIASDFYKSAYDGISNQYLLKVMNKERLEYKFSILLITAGIFSVAIINLYSLNKSVNWIIAILILSIVYLITIVNIFPKAKIAPWYPRKNFNQLEKKLKKNSEVIYKQLIFEMYYLTSQEDKIREQDRDCILMSIFFLVVTAFSMIFIFIFPTDFILIILLLMFISPILFIIFLIYHRFQEEKVEGRVSKINKELVKHFEDLDSSGSSKFIKAMKKTIEDGDELYGNL